MTHRFALAVFSLSVGFLACGSESPQAVFELPDAGPTPEPACPGSEARCGSTCVDTSSNTAHCGSCDNMCASGDVCCAGGCLGAADCSITVSKLDPVRGPMNGAVWVTVRGSGFEKGAKVFLGEARAPAIVLSATEIRMEVPPGPAGLADIRIEQGGKKVVRAQAFQYTAGDLAPPWKVIPLQQLRGENPGLSLLQNGQVLIAGGTAVPDLNKNSFATLELFERNQEKITTAPNPMATVRMQNTAITLLDGRVLLFGGGCDVVGAPRTGGDTCLTNAKLAEIYDPTTNMVRATSGAPERFRTYPRSVLLPDGRVFVSSANDATVEVYDPEMDRFTLIPHANAHVYGFAVRMRDGRVLFGGGDATNATVDIFDPDTNAIKPAGALSQGRSMLTAHTLTNGKVAVLGGSSESGGAIRVPLDSIELYDPQADTWTTSPLKLSVGRTWHASALVRDGSVIAMGGYTINGQCNSSVGTVDRIDFAKGTVTPFAPLPDDKKAVEWNAVTLLDGSVVAVGGGACGTGTALPEVYFLPGAPSPK